MVGPFAIGKACAKPPALPLPPVRCHAYGFA